MQLDLPHKLCQHQTFPATVNKDYFYEDYGTSDSDHGGSRFLHITSSVAWKQWQMPFVSVRNRADLLKKILQTVLLQKLIATQTIKKFPCLWFITMDTTAHDWVLLWTRWIQFTLPEPILLRSTSALPSHPYLSLTCSLPHFTILTTLGNL
jgi:hypothetical protein